MSKKHRAYQGAFLNIMMEKRALPNGHQAVLEWVDHPGAVVIVPFLKRATLILLKQYRAVLDAWIYEMPAGTLEKNEQPLRCARREIREETGYRAGKLTRLGILYPVPGYSTEKLTVYKAEDLSPVKARRDADEIIETMIVSRREAIDLFRSGKIVDAKTVCGLAMIGWL